MAASVENGAPLSASCAACSVSSRAWSSRSFASTSRNETAWNSWIARPNASPLLGVGDRVLDGGAADADRAGGELHARDVEHVHQPAEALALLTQAAVVRDEAVLEVQLARREAPAAELRQALAADEARVAVLDHERGHALRPRAGRDRREDDAEIGDRRVADELLVPVEHVAAVDAPRVRRHRGGIRAGGRLGDRDRARRRIGPGERRQPALLLLVRTQRQHRAGEEARLHDHPRDRRVAPGQLLDHRTAFDRLSTPPPP